jgi:hypothetical protein
MSLALRPFALRSFAVACAFALGAATHVGCDDGGTGFVFEEARAELLRETVDVVILPGYQRAADAAVALRERNTELCVATPDAAGVEASRAAWATLFTSWEATTASHFGPTRDLNLANELAFYPTRPTSIENNIAATDPIDEAHIEALGAAGLGIFAIEYLLFSPADAGEVATALAESPRRCEYLVAASAHVERLTARVVLEWTPYGELFANAAMEGNTEFPSQLRAISTLLTQMINSASVMKIARLAAPLGGDVGSEGDPSVVRSLYAGMSNEGLLAQMDGLRATWTAGVEGRGLGGYLAVEHPALADTILGQMTSTRAAIDAIPDPFEDYVAMPEHPLGDAALLEVRALERSLGIDASIALSVSVMFLDSDGD